MVSAEQAVNFCAYDILRRQLTRAGRRPQQDSSVQERFLAGALSGALLPGVALGRAVSISSQTPHHGLQAC